MMISYTSDVEMLDEESLYGFLDGWQRRPSPALLHAAVRGSQHAIIAVDSRTQRVVGFITILTDGVFSAYISLLEVLPTHRRLGIGSELVRMAVSLVNGCYMIDLTCDAPLQPFYERLGWSVSNAMSIREYKRLIDA